MQFRDYFIWSWIIRRKPNCVLWLVGNLITASPIEHDLNLKQLVVCPPLALIFEMFRLLHLCSHDTISWKLCITVHLGASYLCLTCLSVCVYHLFVTHEGTAWWELLRYVDMISSSITSNSCCWRTLAVSKLGHLSGLDMANTGPCQPVHHQGHIRHCGCPPWPHASEVHDQPGQGRSNSSSCSL